MPTFVVPHRSGAHRVAAIALYRALLSQCKRTPVPAVHGEELYNLIKNRFRGFRHDTSHRHLKLAFEAGYEAVDHLDAAIAGHQDARDYILALLQRAPRHAKIDPRESPKQFLRRHYGGYQSFTEPGSGSGSGSEEDMTLRQKHPDEVEGSQSLVPVPQGQERDLSASSPGQETSKSDQLGEDSQASRVSAEADEDSPFPVKYTIRRTLAPERFFSTFEVNRDPKSKLRNVFAGPIAKEDLGGTGQRHVPVLFNANGIPVLRFKKPMPSNLSSFLNSRIEQRDRRHKYKQEIENQLELAKQEDEWDKIVHQFTGIDSAGEETEHIYSYERQLWVQSATFAHRAVTRALAEEKEKNRVMAQRMQAVVDREAELAQLEMDDAETKGLGGIMDDITEQDPDIGGPETSEEKEPPVRLYWDRSLLPDETS